MIQAILLVEPTITNYNASVGFTICRISFVVRQVKLDTTLQINLLTGKNGKDLRKRVSREICFPRIYYINVCIMFLTRNRAINVRKPPFL